MEQQNLGLDLCTQRTRGGEFFGEMNGILELVEPHTPRTKTEHPPFALETMLRIHFLQLWFGLSGLAVKEAFFKVTLYPDSAGLLGAKRIFDCAVIPRLYHLLEEHHLAAQMLASVNVTLTIKGIATNTTPHSTKNKDGGRGQEMHQTKQGNQRIFGIATYIDVSRLRGWIRRFKGVATKYLASCLGWFRMLDKAPRSAPQPASMLGLAIGRRSTISIPEKNLLF